MNWKLEAILLLHNYTAMQTAVKNLTAQIKLLENEARTLGSHSCESGPVRGGGTREDWLLSNLTKRHALETQLELTRDWIQVAERALAVLEPLERHVLYSLFINYQEGAVEKLCGQLGLERASIYRRRDRALNKLTQALYGVRQEGGAA